MTGKTNNEIYELLGEVKADQRNVLRKMDEMVQAQKAHEAEDVARFATWEKKIGSLNRYYGAVGTVAGSLGGVIGVIIGYYAEHIISKMG